jgi:hypothetical protein
LGRFWVLLESPQGVGLNEGDLEFRYGVRDIEFLIVFVIENSIKLQKWFWKEKLVG